MKSTLFQKPYLPHGVLALIILVAVGVHDAHGNDNNYTEVWRCYDMMDIRKKNALVTLVRDGDSVGEVRAAGFTYSAGFSMKGISRRWNFGENGNYSFIIKLDGTGEYYDGSSSIPDQSFNCERSTG